MTENRHFAGWLRVLAGLVALAGLVGLSACGGGSGAQNNVFNTPGTLAVLPNPAVLYSGTPATLTVAGGQPPYTFVSSDPAALPVPNNVQAGAVNVIPDVVSASTAVTVTARDARGDTALSAVTILPAPLINSLKLKADAFSDSCPNSGGSSTPTDELGTTFICSGQTGSVAVRLANLVGGGLAGRLVRFDIVQGEFQLFTELPGQPVSFALTYTVPTDQNGNAVARIRANPNANTQIVIVQATDVNTGSFVRGVFVIIAVVNANAAGMTVLPSSVTITGPDTLTCSSGVSTTFYVFGGQPPYTVSNTFPQYLLLSQTVVLTSGAGFTVTTLGGCIDKGLFVVTDALGHSITVDLTNKLGTITPPTTTTLNPIGITPSAIPLLVCNASTNAVATGGGTVSVTGNTQTVTPASAFFVSVSRPDILSALPPSPVPGATITLLRLNTGTVNATLAASATVNVSLLVSDGNQVRTVNVPVRNTCP